MAVTRLGRGEIRREAEFGQQAGGELGEEIVGEAPQACST